jgi:hypothetical protein
MEPSSLAILAPWLRSTRISLKWGVPYGRVQTYFPRLAGNLAQRPVESNQASQGKALIYVKSMALLAIQDARVARILAMARLQFGWQRSSGKKCSLGK